MKVWNHHPNDTKRVRLLKAIANHMHDEIISIHSTPIRNVVTELKHEMMVQDFTKLNARLKVARKREEKQFALSLQTEFNFKPKKKKRKAKPNKKETIIKRKPKIK